VEAAVAKPGHIWNPAAPPGFLETAKMAVISYIASLPCTPLGLVAAALLDQAIRGFEKDTLLHDDLVRIGKKALAN
jgi:hypothetical protein